jgi:molybdopterin converting factor small subunit
MVKVRLWSGEELELKAKSLKELLLCLRKIKNLERYVREDGSPTPLLLVFVNGVERSALISEELEEGDVVELFPVLHRG